MTNTQAIFVKMIEVMDNIFRLVTNKFCHKNPVNIIFYEKCEKLLPGLFVILSIT